MYEFIKGKITELNPAYVIIDNNGVGYYISISLQTYSELLEKEKEKLFIHHVVREDAELLFGFISTNERAVFRQLISVNGVGVSTARIMLSSLTSEEIKGAILTGNVSVLKSVKGIGLKSAQRIIVDLKDKIGKVDEDQQIFLEQSNTIKDEALSALVTLGFPKKLAEKAIEKLLQEDKDLTIEEVVKKALKSL